MCFYFFLKHISIFQIKGVVSKPPKEFCTENKNIYRLPVYKTADDLVSFSKGIVSVDEYPLGTMGKYSLTDWEKVEKSTQELINNASSITSHEQDEMDKLRQEREERISKFNNINQTNFQLLKDTLFNDANNNKDDDDNIMKISFSFTNLKLPRVCMIPSSSNVIKEDYRNVLTLYNKGFVPFDGEFFSFYQTSIRLIILFSLLLYDLAI